MNFCLNMCSLMGKGLAVFQKSCLTTQSFFLKMQKYAFTKKTGFESIFISNLSAAGNNLV